MVFRVQINCHGGDTATLDAASKTIETAIRKTTNYTISTTSSSLSLTCYTPQMGGVVGVVANVPVANPDGTTVTKCIEVLCQVTNESQSVVGEQEKLRQVLETQALPASVQYDIQRPQLAVIHPEQYRKEILSKMTEEVRDLKSSFGQDAIVTIAGLEAQVIVQEKEGVMVSMTIPHKTSITLGK